MARRGGRNSAAGCGTLIVMGLCGAAGNAISEGTGLWVGVVAGFVLVCVISAALVRKCPICGDVITKRAAVYTKEINGKTFSNVCTKCKNGVVAKRRKERLNELLN